MTFTIVFPIVSLLALLVYGLAVRPILLSEPALPLEIIFILASVCSVSTLTLSGHSWKRIQAATVARIENGLPAIYILFCIGIVIGSWIVSGTIPMLIYYGIKLIDPEWMYLVAFLVPAIFSTCTGTSWGSAGTIGVVIMGIAGAVEADLPIVAGAVVGGAYFGDKLSPLSDTTNVAALSTGVDLYEHIRSMLNTTVPAAAIAVAGYTILGFLHPPSSTGTEPALVDPTLRSLESLFNFNVLLLLPILIVVLGAVRKKATVPVLILSSLCAGILALLFQPFSLSAVVFSTYKGFDLSMAGLSTESAEGIVGILSRGGLYSMSEPVVITMMVFIFTGSLEVVNAVPTVVDRVFHFARTRAATILSALSATAVTNAMTSNQFATSFIVGDAFKAKFDRLGIPRKVLSRSLEDAGTMLENLLPWTTTGIFMAATLGVPVTEYGPWQFLSLAHFVVAPALAITGIGCFYGEKGQGQGQGRGRGRGRGSRIEPHRPKRG